MFGRIGEKHPVFGRTGETNPMFGKPRPLLIWGGSPPTIPYYLGSRGMMGGPGGSGSSSQKIEVIDLKDNITTVYDSISAAALALNIQQSRISMYFSLSAQAYGLVPRPRARNKNKPYLLRFIFKKLKYPGIIFI